EEVHHVSRGTSKKSFPIDRDKPLERVLAEVNYGGHIGRQLRASPALGLFIEPELHVVDANGPELGSSEIEDLVTGRRSLAQQHVQLVVTVEVVLVGPVADLHTLEELGGDVGIACGGDQRGEPVEAWEVAGLDRARLDLAGPAGNRGGAEATLVDRALLSLERRVAAVGPGESLG